jgi:serine/threonine protein kinase
MGSLRRRGLHISSRSSARGFTPLGKVGSDGAGVLIAARSEASGALVDIRLLAPALKSARTFMRRLGGDMGVLREVRHTNLVSVMQFDKRAGAVVYEAVPGSTLTQLLRAQGPLELPASLVLLEDCISGLEALHNVGVLHRNLTPDSVVVETTGAVLLRDAGLSAPDAPVGLLAEQQPYRAPEVLAGGAPTSASDLYAAAAVFVESLGGRASKTALQAELRPLLSEGMSKDPSKRSATLDNFRRELDDYARATIGESWRKDGRALLVVAAAAQATRAVRVSSPSDPPADGMSDASAAVAQLRSPAPRDPRIWAGFGALGFVALLAIIVLVRGFVSTGQLTPSLLLPTNFLPNLIGSPSSPSPSQSAVPVGPATSAGGNTPGTVVAPIINPTTNPTGSGGPSGSGGPNPTGPPTPNPTGPPLISQVITFTTTPPSGAAYSGSYLVAAHGGASNNPVLFSSLSTGVCKSGVGNTFDFVGVGNCLIQASEAGNSRYSGATNAQSFTVGQATQKISFTSQTPTGATYLGSYTAQATAGGGAVTFSPDGQSTACSVSPSGAVSYVASGTCIIDADQGGSQDYAAAQRVQMQFEVAKASISITSSPACSSACVGPQIYTVTATASPGVTVAFSVSPNPALACSIAGNVVTIAGLPASSCTIDALPANGDPQYIISASQTISYT